VHSAEELAYGQGRSVFSGFRLKKAKPAEAFMHHNGKSEIGP
jgi:hypothetical protein